MSPDRLGMAEAIMGNESRYISTARAISSLISEPSCGLFSVLASKPLSAKRPPTAPCCPGARKVAPLNEPLNESVMWTLLWMLMWLLSLFWTLLMLGGGPPPLPLPLPLPCPAIGTRFDGARRPSRHSSVGRKKRSCSGERGERFLNHFVSITFPPR